MKNKYERIYSLNLISYIISKRPDLKYTYDRGEDGLVYFSFEEDITDLVTAYKVDKDLLNFLATFRKVKALIYEHRYQNKPIPAWKSTRSGTYV